MSSSPSNAKSEVGRPVGGPLYFLSLLGLENTHLSITIIGYLVGVVHESAYIYYCDR
jgi:hypothetical protein